MRLVVDRAHRHVAESLPADGRFEHRDSFHFTLFQDVDIDQSGGFYGSRRFEQQLLAELEPPFIANRAERAVRSCLVGRESAGAALVSESVIVSSRATLCVFEESYH